MTHLLLQPGFVCGCLMAHFPPRCAPCAWSSSIAVCPV